MLQIRRPCHSPRTTTETRTNSYLHRNSKIRHTTNKPTTTHTNINKPNTHQTHNPHTIEAHIAALNKTKTFGDILSHSLKIYFDIDTTFPDRNSTSIFNFYYDKTDTQQPQTTQTAPQEEHTVDQTIDTAMDETNATTYTEIRQKRRISDGIEDSILLMDNKYTTYFKLYRNYVGNSPINS
ncbi:hypothetical protein FHG87_002639 [Trinorchestia longiramus]|nr:hypothetical protein FHG87_002639 [Trinorchestia longiramus]